MWSVIALMWLGTSIVSCVALLAACNMSGTLDAQLEETRLINNLQMQKLAAMQQVCEVGRTA